MSLKASNFKISSTSASDGDFRNPAPMFSKFPVIDSTFV